MKEFMLLIRNKLNYQDNWTSEYLQQFLKKCERYINNLNTDGKLISAQPLVREGKIISGTTGYLNELPFNETEEVMVGYYHIFAKDINEAIDIAKQNPEFEFSTTAKVEVRPIKTKEITTGYIYPEKDLQKM